MDTKLLARMDLNLLVALQVLMEEQSVTRAAQRLYITQPAMSKTLQRLRELFDDPLFIRSGRGLIPTPRAVELASQLPAVLSGVSQLVQKSEFDPQVYDGEMRIMTAEFIAVQVIPSLTRRVIAEAPFMSLTLTSEAGEEVRALEDGQLDFAIEIARPYGSEFHVTPLGSFTPAVWMRTGHPLADREKLTLREMLEYPFIQYYLLLSGEVSAAVESRFDRELAKQGLKRKKTLVTTQLMTAMDALWQTDCLMMATMHDLKMEGETYGIVRKAYPEELEFDNTVPVVLVQHARTIKSPAHQWVKEQIVGIVQEIKERAKQAARIR
ncbi:MAG: LysR family transcriptional regulator [Gammaproteobacteria bacterium]|nr:MAG: LysR family transcriptional regulator [Gammaproteobacteria bacterium]